MTKTHARVATHVPQHVLRRLAQRSLHVLDRHSDRHAVLTSFAARFSPLAQDFAESYDQAQAVGRQRKHEMAAARRAVEELRTTIQVWLPQLDRTIGAVVPASFTLVGLPPEEVITAGDALVQQLARCGEQDASFAAHTRLCLAEITNARDHARQQWDRAQRVIEQHRSHLARARSVATAVQEHLVALRRTIRVLLGRDHGDYQKLRLEHADRVDDDDPDNLPSPSPRPSRPAKARDWVETNDAAILELPPADFTAAPTGVLHW